MTSLRDSIVVQMMPEDGSIDYADDVSESAKTEGKLDQMNEEKKDDEKIKQEMNEDIQVNREMNDELDGLNSSTLGLSKKENPKPLEIILEDNNSMQPNKQNITSYPQTTSHPETREYKRPKMINDITTEILDNELSEYGRY